MSHKNFRYTLAGFLVALVAPLIHSVAVAVNAAIDFAEACLKTCQGVGSLVLRSISLVAFKVIEHLKPEYDASYRSGGRSIDLCSRC